MRSIRKIAVPLALAYAVLGVASSAQARQACRPPSVSNPTTVLGCLH